ncbi:cellulose-binding domain-containing protein [Streptomyces ipomoeae]|uniref:Cellulose binding domain protein n=1 Tax=Streptomyces ipomoeae 91-03 TaxID=698759 RepID=L1L2U1_9ACTN|nr:cellulose-binding domain-containing protein [Streptomyces ipomoeae]EKX67366.1 cellulose binding domain protein [Streptomyces ipomoeae 91-03]MDX2697916.1 cellulose-binding domain-containing protein [Streptomyces ipomoeae]MDX2823233.1 cellulose-binding domain-containing protein [Streptomyces ipomoeae]MDX2841431.1 cellulose-binding domain-containing protein [Streptomyces ipomoeae]MDX2877878.1 cellulose-binding domain-containing protein [Streptomyces ipomoeae]
MPDLPKPQDAAEAALFSECWDAVLSYADLCTSGSIAATQLATEAFSNGMQESRALEVEAGAGRGVGRRTLRLPRIPFLLTWVRTSAAAWERDGQGHRLDPDLRLWLNSDKAARYTGPPLQRPLALRALRDMQEPDAALLWLAEVESLPLTSVARRLGLDPSVVRAELDQVRALFRDRCHRNQLDTPVDTDCHNYARLLDAITRSPGTDTPEDLSRHLATCVECAEAAACLGLHGGGLPAALAGGVIGWGGLAYLERRRRAAEAGLLPGRADSTGTDRGLSPGKEPGPRIGRNGLLVGAGIVSVLALAVSLMPLGDDDTVAEGASAGESSVVQQDSSVPATRPGQSGVSSEMQSTSRPQETGSDDGGDGDGDGGSNEQPQGDSSTPARVSHEPVEPGNSSDATCHVRYKLVNEWPGGFQATVTVTSSKDLDGWSIGWTYEDGQRITQMWDGAFDQDGSRVTATAADYNRTVTEGATFGVGFLGSWDNDENAAPRDFTLNGSDCETVD